MPLLSPHSTAQQASHSAAPKRPQCLVSPNDSCGQPAVQHRHTTLRTSSAWQVVHDSSPVTVPEQKSHSSRSCTVPPTAQLHFALSSLSSVSKPHAHRHTAQLHFALPRVSKPHAHSHLALRLRGRCRPIATGGVVLTRFASGCADGSGRRTVTKYSGGALTQKSPTPSLKLEPERRAEGGPLHGLELPLRERWSSRHSSLWHGAQNSQYADSPPPRLDAVRPLEVDVGLPAL